MTAELTRRPVVDPPAPPGASGAGGSRRWATAGVTSVVLLGIVLRARSPSALWLDEAISANISSLPVGEIPHALRHDGSPPLYAFLLWGWEHVFGGSPVAVRSLSAVFGVAALALAAVGGARLAGRRAAVAAPLLLASSPFAVRYSTEARMYSLVALLVLCGVLALDGYLRGPGRGRGLLVCLVSGALALTHYWALFLLAVVAVALLVPGLRRRSRIHLAAVGWLAAGGLLFVPWLPSFAYQLTHTGTPWGRPAGFAGFLATLGEWSGGVHAPARLLALALLVLTGLGALAVTAAGPRLELDLRGRPPGRALALVVGGTLGLGLAAGQLTGSAYAARYTSVVLPLFLLLAAVGVARLPAALAHPFLVVAVVCGLAGSVPLAFDGARTEAPVVAQALRSQALPGDVVVYCPDQLGPATSRLLPGWLRQEVYPTGGSPTRVDWADYAQRNHRADPVAYARDLSARAGDRVVWLVAAGGYRTYEGQCEALTRTLIELRGQPLELVQSDPLYFEPESVAGWAPVSPPRTLR